MLCGGFGLFLFIFLLGGLGGHLLEASQVEI